MYSALFTAQAIVHVFLTAWLVLIWRRTGLAIALALVVPQFGLVWDNGIVGLGRWIGIGPTLEALSWPRFWLHWLFGAWLIIACGSILRLAGFEWARNNWLMASFCVLTVAFMIMDLPYFWTQSLYPVCEYDLVRYSTSVSQAMTCSAEQLAAGNRLSPLPQIVACFIVIGTGLLLWVQRRWPWMFWGGLLMFISALPAMSRFKLDNFGEILITGSVIWAIAHFARDRVPSGAVSAAA